jgi:hypothetical protein
MTSEWWWINFIHDDFGNDVDNDVVELFMGCHS